MKTLVVFGTKLGGTRGIAFRIGDALRSAGHSADVRPADQVRSLDGYDAVIIGGALYAFTWHADARKFVLRHARALREREVWFFSSGPLDDSASRKDIAPTPLVQQLMDAVGANGHMTFGGRIEPNAKGFMAAQMAKQNAGDWRDPAQITAWAGSIARVLDQRAVDPASRTHRASKPLPTRNPLLSLTLFTGLTALGGGLALVVRPDGSWLKLPLWVLAHSPFRDFLVPGVLLLLCVGVASLWAAWMHFRRAEWAPFVSLASGLALVVWIAVEMIMLRSMHWSQLFYLFIGVFTVNASGRAMRKFIAVMKETLPPRGPAATAEA